MHLCHAANARDDMVPQCAVVAVPRCRSNRALDRRQPVVSEVIAENQARRFNKIAALIPDQRGPGDNDPAPITTTGVMQTMHSFGQMNLYPWGWTGSLAPNDADLGNIARHMSAVNAGGNGYDAHTSYNLYAVDGDTVDWAYGERGIAAVYFLAIIPYSFDRGKALAARVVKPPFVRNGKSLID